MLTDDGASRLGAAARALAVLGAGPSPFGRLRGATRYARPAAAVAFGTFVALLLVHMAGPVGLVAPIAVVALLAVLGNPRVAFVLLIGCAILFETSSPNVLHFTTDQIHDPLPGHYDLLQILMVLAVCSVVLDASRRRSIPLRPAPFGLVLALLALALISGSIVGHYAGQGFNPITEQLRGVLPLIVVPWLAVNAIRDTRDLRRMIAFIGVLTVVKSALGLLGVLTHVGVAAGGTSITYYEPAVNWLAMGFILMMLASAIRRVPMRRVAQLATLIVLLSLVFSLRRSFWIGTVAAVPVLLLIVTPRAGRRFLVPALLVLVCAVWMTLSSGIVVESQSPVVQRIQSLNPTHLTTNAEDRYRLDERKNVIAAIRATPLVGLGFAVPWQERYPLSVEQPGGGRLYVHMAILWYWLKLGVIGLVSYIGYLLAAIVVGIQVFRRHHDARVRLMGAAAAASFVGLAVVETTATFLGVDDRMTVLAGCLVGLLSVARSDAAPVQPAAAVISPLPRERRRPALRTSAPMARES